MRSLEERLMNLSMPVTECGCWIFTGYILPNGYGQIHAKNTTLAHRASYEVFCGPIPEGMDVMHSCDVKACINPDHLSVGTRAVNMADMVAKNRQAKGIQNASAKLTEADVLAIRSSSMEGKKLARMMGISQAVVSLIRCRKLWRHI
jgi:hypothetical protein